MAIPVYAWLYDDAGNLIKGSADVSGRENSIEVLSVMSLTEVPVDPYTGKSTSARCHQPLYFDKVIDSSTPCLLKALTNGEKLKSAKFDYYRINDNGQEEHYFTLFLEGVQVCSNATLMYDIKSRYGSAIEPVESVALSYEKLTSHYVDGNILHADSWRVRA